MKIRLPAYCVVPLLLLTLVTTAAAAQTPDLRPIAMDYALELAAYARTLRTVHNGVASPVAWSMINWECTRRAMALQYALADERMFGQPYPRMDEAELTLEHVQQVIDAPAVDAAVLTAAGPLITHQAYLRQDPVNGTWQPLPGGSEFEFWSYHRAVVLNVDGTLMVLDLSASDTPVPIDQWMHKFVPESVACPQLDEQRFRQVKSYWDLAFTNVDPGFQPAEICGYKLTPLFRLGSDETAVEALGHLENVPFKMEVQTGAFLTHLAANHDTEIPRSEAPYIRSTYGNGTLAELCDESMYPGFLICRDNTEIYDSVAYNGQVSSGEEQFFYFQPPWDPGVLDFTLTTSAPGVRLYIRHYGWPTTGLYDCAGDAGQTVQRCVLPFDPVLNDHWLVMVRSESAAADFQLSVSTQIPFWDANGLSYDSGNVVFYDNTLWRCRYGHVSNADWYPGAPGVYLWEIENSSSGQWLPNVRYSRGDVVSYNETAWECQLTHTSQTGWEPGTPGIWFWSEVGY